MARLRTRTKKRQQDSIGSLSESIESLFESRPFSVQTQSSQPEAQQKLPTNASFSNAQRFGHTLGQFAISADRATPATVQPKLAMGKAGDAYEQNADRVAATVVNTQAQQSDKAAISRPKVQPLVQAQSEGTDIALNPRVEQSIEAKRGSGASLADDVREPMEDSFAANFSDVTVHTDAESDRLNRSLNSRAFTTGNDIFFKQGEYRPGDRQGKELLAHELTHVVQQGGGQKTGNGVRSHPQVSPKPLLQAKPMMTAAELEKETGTKGAKVFHKSSYEKIVNDLREYETLTQEDKGDKANQRVQLLTKIVKEIDLWNSSRPKDKVKGDDKIRSALTELKSQVEEERYILLPFKRRGDQEKRQAVRLDETSTDTTTNAEVKKQHKEQQSFFTKEIIEKIGNFFQYTFGKNFNPVGLALDPKDTLLPDEIKQLVELMDQAAELEEQWANTPGISPEHALALAYMYVPKQLRPGSAEPDAKLAFRVKRQLFLEAITKKENNQSSPGQTPSSAITPGSTGGTGGVSNVPASANPSATRSEKSAGEQVTEDVLGTSRTILDISSFVKDRGKNAVDMAQVRSNTLTGITRKAEVMGFDAASGLLNLTDNVFNLFKAIKTFITTKEKLQRLEAIKQLASSADGTYQSGLAFEKACRTAVEVGKASLAGATKAVVKDLVPGIKIAARILSGIQQLVHIVFKIYRVANEFSLKKQAKQAGLAIKGAIKRVGLRNLELLIRDGVKQVLETLSIISGIVELVTGPIGGIVDQALNVSKLIVNIGDDIIASKVLGSYRAGVAQEADKAAFAGKAGSETKVFKKNTQWALTGIILEAKGGNTIALEMLKGYFINEQMVKESSVENLRNFLMAELRDEADPKTITQKLLAIKRSIFGR